MQHYHTDKLKSTVFIYQRNKVHVLQNCLFCKLPCARFVVVEHYFLNIIRTLQFNKPCILFFPLHSNLHMGQTGKPLIPLKVLVCVCVCVFAIQMNLDPEEPL